MKKTLAPILLLLVLLVTATGSASPSREGEEALIIGKVAENVNAPYMEEGGLPSKTDFFTEADFRSNTVTVVNYWDSGCMNCRGEMPHLQLLHETYSEMGISVLGVATRRIGGSYEYGWQLLGEMGITYPNVIVDEGFARLVEEYFAVPMTLYIDSAGKVLDARPGRMEYDEMELRALRLLALPGDADCDGRLTSADVSALAAYVMNAGELAPMGRAAADIDRDLEVNAADVSRLIELFVGPPDDMH